MSKIKYIIKKHSPGIWGCLSAAKYFIVKSKKLVLFLIKDRRWVLFFAPCQVCEHKMFLNPRDMVITSYLFCDGIWEALETDLVRKEIKRGDVVLDIGANIGYYTLLFAKLVGDEGKVFAFEPDPRNFALLKKNVELNGYKNVILVQKAVSNKTGKAKLYLCEESLGSHSIVDIKDAGRFIEIETVRLDDYFKDFDEKINFIKMDIEGAELLAIEGMSDLLNRNQKLKIACEYWPNGIKMSGRSPEGYLRLLISHGFELFLIDNSDNRIKPVDIPAIRDSLTREKNNYVDLFCVKEK